VLTGTEPTAQVGGGCQAAPLAEQLKTAPRRRERRDRCRDLPRHLAQAREQHVLPANAGRRAQRQRLLEQADGLLRAATEDLGHSQVVQGASVASKVSRPVHHAACFPAERARPLAVTECGLRERDAGQCDGGAAPVGDFRPQVGGRPEAFPGSGGIAAAAEQVPALIGAMIVAPLGTPTMGIGLAVVIGGGRRLWRSAGLVAGGNASSNRQRATESKRAGMHLG